MRLGINCKSRLEPSNKHKHRKKNLPSFLPESNCAVRYTGVCWWKLFFWKVQISICRRVTHRHRHLVSTSKNHSPIPKFSILELWKHWRNKDAEYSLILLILLAEVSFLMQFQSYRTAGELQSASHHWSPEIFRSCICIRAREYSPSTYCILHSNKPLNHFWCYAIFCACNIEQLSSSG